jgi:hypothetical protein
MQKTPLQFFKQDKVKLANPIFKRTRQAAAKVKIERGKKSEIYMLWFFVISKHANNSIYSLDLQQHNYAYAKNIQ